MHAVFVEVLHRQAPHNAPVNSASSSSPSSNKLNNNG